MLTSRDLDRLDGLGPSRTRHPHVGSLVGVMCITCRPRGRLAGRNLAHIRRVAPCAGPHDQGRSEGRSSVPMPTNARVTVAVESDLDIVAAGVRSLLEPFADRLVVIDRTPGEPVDVVLVDATGRADVDAGVLDRLARDPSVRHLALYALSLSMRSMREAQRFGVRSFLSKSLDASRLAESIVQIAAGRDVDTPGIRSGAGWLGRDDGLTERESEVLQLCADGMSNREIAEHLYVNVETVKSHLKHAYSRLGLRNRAQAAAYVHRITGAGPIPSVPPVVGEGDRGDRGDRGGRGDLLRPAPADVGIDLDELHERRRVMGLDGAARQALRRVAAAVNDGSDDFTARLVERWAALPQTAPLVADPVVAGRLLGHQRGYLYQLFTGELDEGHVASMLRTGATHHRIRLSPQWYLTSLVHVVCDHLDLIFDGAHDPAEAVTTVSTLIGSVLFDASLVLDAYELSVAEQIVRDFRPNGDAGADEPPTAPSAPAVPMPRERPIVKVSVVDHDEAVGRRRFVGLDDTAIGRLRDLAPAVEAAMPEVLRRFYELVERDPAMAVAFAPGTAERLRVMVAQHWRRSLLGDFDMAQVAACSRIGVIHERAGIAPQHYLAGLAHQLAGVLGAILGARTNATGTIDRDDVRDDVAAVVRAAFFEMSFVIDAYLDARAEVLLQTGRFARQVVAGLANGIAIVDARDRIEYANEELLALTDVSAAVLRRMPLDSALPVDGVLDLVDEARRSIVGRATMLHRARGRDLRVTALRVQRSTGPAGQVAIVLDDITDVLRASDELDRDDQWLEHVLTAVQAIAWEIEVETLTVLAISRAVEPITGHRVHDLLGRPLDASGFLPDEVTAMRARIRALVDGQRDRLDHRLVLPDGRIRWIRSTLVSSTSPAGIRTISGVSVDITDAHDELERLRADVARLDRSIVTDTV